MVQVVVLRPLIGEPVISIVMVTIGLSIFFQALLRWIFGVFTQAVPTGVFHPVGQHPGAQRRERLSHVASPSRW